MLVKSAENIENDRKKKEKKCEEIWVRLDLFIPRAKLYVIDTIRSIE